MKKNLALALLGVLFLNAKARRLAFRLLFALLAYPRFWRLLLKQIARWLRR